jgi:nicotinate-nucleotide adenylyltransferase
MTRVALFGGSFDPPHIAHQMVCLVVLESCAVDEVWMTPTYRHAFAKDLTPFAHRREMCARAVAVFGERARVCEIEADLAAGRERPSRTLDTLDALRARHPDVSLRVVLGADILGETDKWYRWSDVVAIAPPIVVGRRGYVGDAGPATAPGGVGVERGGESHRAPGHGVEREVDAGIEFVDVVLPNVSSTDIRARLARGETAVPLVPRAVMDYIAERGLYR